jgi:hypothetical protein
MNPYTLHVLARINHEERLAQAESSRRLRYAKRARRRETPAEVNPPAAATTPACSTA